MEYGIILAASDLASVAGEDIKTFILIVAGALGIAVYAKQLFFAPKQEKVPQPLSVEMVKALHEQFADKELFEDHVAHNTERHGQIFNKIDAVERQARIALDTRMGTLQEERALTLEKLNAQFTFIRESIAAINTELKIRNE
jgi:hypothetical protein